MPDSHLGLEGGAAESDSHPLPGQSHAHSWARPAVWIVLLLAVCVLTLFANLGGKDLWGADESRHVQRAREMVADRQWMRPTYIGQANFDKPPVHYWLMAGAGLLLGPTETVFRLPAATFGLLTVLLTFALGAHLYGVRAGGLAGFVLATAFLFVFYARAAFIDVPLVACITGAVLAGHLALRSDRGWVAAGGLTALFLAGGTLGKGLAGLVLPLLVLGASGSAAGRWGRLAGITGAAVLLAAPLYVGLGSEFTGRFLSFDHLRRFLVAQDELGGDNPWYFYGPALLGNFLPWTILLPAVGLALASAPNAWRRWRLPLAWFAVTFVVLTLGANKREPYLLTLFPALALLVGAAADDLLAGRAQGRLLTCWRLCLAAVGVTFAAGGPLLPALWPARLGTVHWGLWPLVLAGGGLWVAYGAIRRTGFEVLAATGLLVLAGLQLTVWQLFPAMNATRSARAAAAQVRTAAGAAPLAVTKDVHPGLVFYLDLPRPAEALVPAEAIGDALQAGRLVLTTPAALPPDVLASGRGKVRATVRFQRLEFVVIEDASGRPPG